LDARAQSSHDPAAADELFERGKELLRAGNWPEACAKFEASMELDPAVGTLLKLAKCSEHDGKLALALHDYQTALALNRDKPDQTDARRAELDAFTRAALLDLEPRVPKLRVIVLEPPSGLRVTRGGADLPIAALGEDLPVDPGPFEVVATAPGFQTERRSVVLEPGEIRTLTVSLSREPPSSRPAASERSPTVAFHTRNPDARRLGAYVVGGVGILSLAVAGYFAIETVVKVSDASPYCTNGYCKSQGYNDIGDASRDQTAGFVLLAVGAGLVGTGLALFFTSPGRHSDGPGAATGSLAVGPTGVLARGTW
jgi:hypothetical protein